MQSFAQLHKYIKSKQFANTQCFGGFGSFVGMYYNLNKLTAHSIVKTLLVNGFTINKQQSSTGCLVLSNNAYMFTVCNNGKNPPVCILSFTNSAVNALTN